MRIAWMLMMIPSLCFGQEVYISVLGQPLPDESTVRQSIDKWNEALGINMRFAGYTNVPCVDGGITFRMPEWNEWAAFAGDAKYGLFAKEWPCRPEAAYTGAVVLHNPFWGNPTVRVETHELGHAIGAHHVGNPDAIMSPYVSGESILADDVKSVADCVVTVSDSGVVNIPSVWDIAQATLAPEGDKWKVVASAPQSFYCLGNYQLDNGNYVLSQVVTRTGRYRVVMVPVLGGWKIGKVAAY